VFRVEPALAKTRSCRRPSTHSSPCFRRWPVLFLSSARAGACRLCHSVRILQRFLLHSARNLPCARVFHRQSVSSPASFFCLHRLDLSCFLWLPSPVFFLICFTSYWPPLTSQVLYSVKIPSVADSQSSSGLGSSSVATSVDPHWFSWSSSTLAVEAPAPLVLAMHVLAAAWFHMPPPGFGLAGFVFCQGASHFGGQLQLLQVFVLGACSVGAQHGSAHP
jgi:hypothetical protein